MPTLGSTPAVSALLRHYAQRLAQRVDVTDALHAAGLGVLLRGPRRAGLVDRTAARVLTDRCATDARTWRVQWRAAGLLRASGHQVLGGCLVLPLWTGHHAPALVGRRVADLAEPRGTALQRNNASAGLLVAPSAWPAPPHATWWLCSDPFDAVLLAGAGCHAAAFLDGPDQEAGRALLTGWLARRRIARAVVCCAATSEGERARAEWLHAWRRVAPDAVPALHDVRLPAGLGVCGLRRIEGEHEVRRLVQSADRWHPVRRVSQAAVPRAESVPPWAPAATPLARHLSLYCDAIRDRRRSPEELRRLTTALGVFWRWCVAAGLRDTTRLTVHALERFQRACITAEGAQRPSPLAAARRVSTVRGFLQWAHRTGRQRRDLSTAFLPLRRPSAPRPLLLSPCEIEAALAGLDATAATGLRDRAMFEVLYSTGIRRSELTGLDLHDVDAATGVLRIRRGKGGRSRRVPIGARALAWVAAYIERVRSRHLTAAHEPALFLSRRGRRLGPKTVTARMHACLWRAGIRKPGSCHIVRHSVATMMHDAGADIRDLQALLGHATLTSTQLYTQVSVRRLQEVHRRTHPAEGDRAARLP